MGDMIGDMMGDTLTRVPDVLDPHVGARCEEEPVDRDEEEADHVAGQGDADEEYWERLKFANIS